MKLCPQHYTDSDHSNKLLIFYKLIHKKNFIAVASTYNRWMDTKCKPVSFITVCLIILFNRESHGWPTVLHLVKVTIHVYIILYMTSIVVVLLHWWVIVSVLRNHFYTVAGLTLPACVIWNQGDTDQLLYSPYKGHHLLYHDLTHYPFVLS